MIYLLYALHVIVCVFLILVVLLQQGKGADLSVFGGGSTQTAFGARGATTLLHKLTVASFVVFILTTLAIGIPQLAGGGSVISGASGGAATAPKAGAKSLPAPGQPGAKSLRIPVKPGTAAPVAPGKPGAAPVAPPKPSGAPSAPASKPPVPR